MKFNLKNKIAIVTGASQGIGKIIAFELAKSGAHVVCISRNKKAIESIVDEITQNNGNHAFPVHETMHNPSYFLLIFRKCLNLKGSHFRCLALLRCGAR